jgi:hypothetical protein
MLKPQAAHIHAKAYPRRLKNAIQPCCTVPLRVSVQAIIFTFVLLFDRFELALVGQKRPDCQISNQEL